MACKFLLLVSVVFCLLSDLEARGGGHHGHLGHHGHHGHHRYHGHHGYRGYRGCVQYVVTAGCRLHSDPTATSVITGSIHFTQVVNCHHRSPVRVRIHARGFTDQDESQHGVHIHSLPVNGSNCASAGGHYNPFNKKHAGRLQPDKKSPPEHVLRRVGDLGNAVEVDNKINVRFNDHVISLVKRDGLRNIIGKSFVIHAKRDDLGQGGDAGSLASGNAGPRMACCTIRRRSHYYRRHHPSKPKGYRVL